MDQTSVVTISAPTVLPAQERRRASLTARLALVAVEQALHACPFSADSLRSVFASDEGTGEVLQQMMESLASVRQVSPMAFSNSVLNAPSGYFAIAWRSHEPATVVSLGTESFASGLLCAVMESLSCRVPVLLVVYDPPMTVPLSELLPIVDAKATAWVISCQDGPAPSLATFDLSLESAASDVSSPLPVWMPPHWAGQASGRSLSALALLEGRAGDERRFMLGRQALVLRLMRGLDK